jgi:hypothetical protein
MDLQGRDGRVLEVSHPLVILHASLFMVTLVVRVTRFQMPILQDVTASDVDRIEADLEKLFATLFSYPTGGVGSSDDAPENTLRLPPEIPRWL